MWNPGQLLEVFTQNIWNPKVISQFVCQVSSHEGRCNDRGNLAMRRTAVQHKNITLIWIGFGVFISHLEYSLNNLSCQYS